MKKIIFLGMVITALSISAQNGIKEITPISENQIEVAMNKISSNSDLRVSMMYMMIDSTSGNEEEMTILAKCLIDDPGMYELLTILQQKKRRNISSEIHGKMLEIDTEVNGLIMKQIK